MSSRRPDLAANAAKRARPSVPTRLGSTRRAALPVPVEQGREVPMSASLVRAVGICVAVAAPAIVLRVSGAAVPAPVSLLAFGAAVVAASFVLAWAADAARKDISGPLAVALLALVAVLPEYAVDLFYAFRSGSDAAYLPFAAANMNGSNRLLLGLGWPLVVLLALWVARRRREPGYRGLRFLSLPSATRRDIAVLAVLTVIALLIPLTGSIPLWLGVVLITAFLVYLWSATRSDDDSEEPFVSVAAHIVALPRLARRATVAAMFVGAAAVILVSAEPFAESLIASGTSLGVDPYFLVQWLAPLASESPEFIVASLFALRGQGAIAIATLIASKINQWSLLIGSLPIAHLLGGGEWQLALDARQVEEFTLTASQTMLGIAILLSLRFHRASAIALAALFALQFVITGTHGRYVLAAAHTVIALGVFIVHRRHILPTLTALWRPTSYSGDDPDPRSPRSREDEPPNETWNNHTYAAQHL